MNQQELLNKSKPILFNTEMVVAILDNKKTVTRRIVKFKGTKNPNWTGYVKDGLNLYNGNNEVCNEKPPYKVGDILYVRETWCWCPCWDCGMDTSGGVAMKRLINSTISSVKNGAVMDIKRVGNLTRHRLTGGIPQYLCLKWWHGYFFV